MQIGIGIGPGFVPGKGRKGGSPAPGQSLFDAYKTRVEDDSGAVQNEAATLELFNSQVEQSLRSSLVMHVAAQAGNRLTSGNVNKAYGLNNKPYYDAVQGAAAAQPELIADGYQFGTGTERLEFSGSDVYAPTGDITVMTWVRRNAIHQNTQAMIGKLGPLGDQRAFLLQMQTSGTLRLLIATSSTSVNAFFGIGQIPSEQFHHIAITYDVLAQEIQFYIDGQLDATHTAADGVPSAQFNDNGLSWAYGDRSGGSDSVDARLNDGRIYDAALSASQIQAIYNNTQGFYGIS